MSSYDCSNTEESLHVIMTRIISPDLAQVENIYSPWPSRKSKRRSQLATATGPRLCHRPRVPSPRCTRLRHDALADLPNVTVLALDVTSDESVAEAARVVAEQIGGRLDFLVNNADSQYVMPALDLDIEVARQMYEVNVWGVVAVIKAFAPLVMDAMGTIANLASISGLVRPPYMGVYAGSKSACEAISEALRPELQPFGVKVLTVIVGAVKTNIFASGPGYELPRGSRYEPARTEVTAPIAGNDVEGRLGKPEDFAKNLVGDIVGGATGAIGHGNMSGLVRFATAVFPRFLLDRLITNGTGLEYIGK